MAKIESQHNDTIVIPEGYRAVVENGRITFQKEFKDGDVLHSTESDELLIFKKYTGNDEFSSHCNYSEESDSYWIARYFRHATEEEKQLLFNKMTERGLRWNAEDKRIETIKWRANGGEKYFYINSKGVIKKDEEKGYCDDECRYAFGNYFRTYEQAKEVAKRMKEVSHKYHYEIGEWFT